MIYNTGKYIDILIKLDITANQFLFCWLVYNKQWKDIKRLMNHIGQPLITPDELQLLMNRDVIINIAPKSREQVTASELIVTELFANEMIVEPEDAWEEFFDKYPGKMKVQGSVFAAKGLTIGDEKACREKYQGYINKNKYKHQEILLTLEEYSKQNDGYATMKIDKFIIGEFWNEIEKGRGNNYATTPIF